ncbi:MAG: hypothetical protein K9L32_12775 [Chromatiaceae bacterium]|nr:hypothetical protein [Chromatiaceae bacterium]
MDKTKPEQIINPIPQGANPMTPDLSHFENLHCDLHPDPEVREFGELCKRVAAHAQRYRMTDQAFLLARLAVVAGFHMGRSHRELWPEIERHHKELLTMIEIGDETGVRH